MRFFSVIVAAVIAVGVQAGAAEECGALGVFAPKTIPEGVDPNALRKCAEHPLHNTTTSPGTPQLRERACFFGDSYGCSGGYCWKQCNTPGSGQWCWTAWNAGWGNWRTCGGRDDCNLVSSADCGQGGCKECGCSC